MDVGVMKFDNRHNQYYVSNAMRYKGVGFVFTFTFILANSNIDVDSSNTPCIVHKIQG